MIDVRIQNLQMWRIQRSMVIIQLQMRMIMRAMYFLLELKPKQLNEEDLLKSKIYL